MDHSCNAPGRCICFANAYHHCSSVMSIAYCLIVQVIPLHCPQAKLCSCHTGLYNYTLLSSTEMPVQLLHPFCVASELDIGGCCRAPTNPSLFHSCYSPTRSVPGGTLSHCAIVTSPPLPGGLFRNGQAIWSRCNVSIVLVVYCGFASGTCYHHSWAI